MLFTLQSWVKIIHIKNETWIFCSFQSANPKFFHQYHVFFRFMFHLTCMCKPAVLPQMIVLCFEGPCTVFILIYPHWFLLYPFKKVCWLRVVLFSHAALTHTHRFQTLSWTRWNDWKANLKFVQCHHWLVKIGEKKQDEMKKKKLCDYLQWRRHGKSGHWVRKVPANQNTGNIEGKSVFRAIIVASW